MIAHLEQVTVVQTSNPHSSPQKTFPQPHPSAPQPQSYFHLSTATNSQFGSEFNKSGICNLRSPPDAHCCNRLGCGGLHPGFQCPSSQSTDMPHQEPPTNLFMPIPNKPTSSVNAERLRSELQGYPDQSIADYSINGFRFRFDIGYTGP